MRKPAFCICKEEVADQLCGNRAADQRLCFPYIVQCLYFLNPKFQASNYLLWLYNPVCVKPGRKPQTCFLKMRLTCTFFTVYQYVKLFPHFDFYSRNLVLNRSVPGHCLYFYLSPQSVITYLHQSFQLLPILGFFLLTNILKIFPSKR